MDKRLLYFECCDVLERGRPATSLCWVCKGQLGNYNDIPMHQGTSTVHMAFSQVKKEFLKCLTP